jgi:hypothetical protein
MNDKPLNLKGFDGFLFFWPICFHYSGGSMGNQECASMLAADANAVAFNSRGPFSYLSYTAQRHAP